MWASYMLSRASLKSSDMIMISNGTQRLTIDGRCQISEGTQTMIRCMRSRSCHRKMFMKMSCHLKNKLPESPSYPELPESPSCPELPESPSCPELPESPSCPELPGSPSCPGLPGSPSCPELPESPSCPELPESPSCPELPESPSCPELPESPSCPGPAARVPSLGSVTRVPAPEAPHKWAKLKVERGPHPAPEPPPRIDAHPDPTL
ncbi:uncharacterized protein ACWYII_034863 [Salvelinus alpinus]